jgi:GMP synthase-like glutamine amidotransferase
MCIVDMNDGHENSGDPLLSPALHGVSQARSQDQPPTSSSSFEHVSVRDKNEMPSRDCDLYVSSGGPGSPFDGDGKPWVKGYCDFLDHVADDNQRRGVNAKALFGVCYTYEMMVRHFDVCHDDARADSRKFGVMPIYTTAYGREHSLLAPFRDRLFAFEHRNWEADRPARPSQLAKSSAVELFARESRDGQDDKAAALLGFDVTPRRRGGAVSPRGGSRRRRSRWVLGPSKPRRSGRPMVTTPTSVC